MSIILGVVLLPICYIKNNEWLMLSNWHMSDEVEKAMRIDSDNRASEAWVHGGRKGTYTMLHELGYAYRNYDIDGYAKPIFFLGYWTGCKYGARLDSLETEIRTLRGENNNLREHLRQIPEADQELIDQNRELEYINGCLNQLVRELRSQNKELENELAYHTNLSVEGQFEDSKLEISSKTGDFYGTHNEPKVMAKGMQNSVYLVTDQQDQERSLGLIEDIVTNTLSSEKLSIQRAAEHYHCKKWIVQHVREALRDFENGESLEAVSEKSRLSTEELETILECIA